MIKVDLPELTIATPFYNSSLYIPRYFKHMIELEYPKEIINIVFTDNGSKDTSLELLKSFKEEYKDHYKNIKIISVKRVSEKGKFKGHSNIVKSVKTMIRNSHTDTVFIGSDCFPPKDGMMKLIRLSEHYKADIGAGITLVGGAQANIQGILVKGIPVISAYTLNQKTGKFQSISRIKMDKPYVSLFPRMWMNKISKIDGIGTGFAIIKKKVLDKVPFKVNLRYGEDLFLCLNAKLMGFKIMVDTSLWYDHWHYSYTSRSCADGEMFVVKGIRDKERGMVEPITDKNKYNRYKSNIRRGR